MNPLQPVNPGSTFFKMDSIVKKARQLLERGFEDAGIDLTADQWVLIERLHNTNLISQQQLAFESFKDAGTTTRILDLLCKKEFVVRMASASDRRSFCVCLTEKGRDIFERAKEQSRIVRSRGFGALSADQFKLLNELLENIYATICSN